MGKTIAKTRPRPVDYTGTPGAFIDAIRQHEGLSFRALAQQLKKAARGKKTHGSENYLYRLCRQEADLRPELIDLLAKTLRLNKDEVTFLQQVATLGKPDAPPKQGRKTRASRLLKILGTDTHAGQTAEPLARALIDPVVIAVYTLLGKPRTNTETLPRRLAKSATSKLASTPRVRKAIATLQQADVIRGNKKLKQTKDKDILVRAEDNLPAGFKSEALKLLYSDLDRWGIDALNQLPREQRYFQSHMFLIETARQAAFQEDLHAGWDKLKQKLRKKYESNQGDVVMHMGVRAWPMLEFMDDSDQGGTDHA